jgi:hypothetical protein
MKTSRLRNDLHRIHVGRVALEDSSVRSQARAGPHLQLLPVPPPQLFDGILGIGCYPKGAPRPTQRSRDGPDGSGSAWDVRRSVRQKRACMWLSWFRVFAGVERCAQHEFSPPP